MGHKLILDHNESDKDTVHRQGFKRFWKNRYDQIDETSLDKHAMIDRDDDFAILPHCLVDDFWGRDLRKIHWAGI